MDRKNKKHANSNQRKARMGILNKVDVRAKIITRNIEQH